MTQRLDKVKIKENDKVRDPSSNLATKWARGPINEKNIVAQTKFGVYSCPSLRIAENQE